MTFLDAAVGLLFLSSWAALWWSARPVRLPRVRLARSSAPAPEPRWTDRHGTSHDVWFSCPWPIQAGGSYTTAKALAFRVLAPAAPWRTAP